MQIGEFTGEPDDIFIDRRDRHVERVTNPKTGKKRVKLEDAYRRWDCEFPEYHQSQIDTAQTLFEGNGKLSHHHIDTIDEEYGALEYKQNSKDGVRIGHFTWEQLQNGITDHVVVWEWSDRNTHKRLYKNEKVSYKIFGAVPAAIIIKESFIAGYDDDGKPIRRFKFNKDKKYV